MAKTILAVDDDPFILKVVEKFLTIKGYKVVGMTDPEQAYFWAEKNKPDLGIFPTRRSGRLTPKAFRAYRELLLRECAAWAFQLLQLTLARLRWSVASGRRVCRSYAAMMC